jgi:hypothetical protein
MDSAVFNGTSPASANCPLKFGLFAYYNAIRPTTSRQVSAGTATTWSPPRELGCASVASSVFASAISGNSGVGEKAFERRREHGMGVGGMI